MAGTESQKCMAWAPGTLEVMACFLVLGTGNLLMAGLAFWMFCPR